MRALVVIPTYNEAGSLTEVLERLKDAAPEVESLVVDDGSPDGTADLAEKVGSRLGGVSILRRDGKQGLGTAYRDGFQWGLRRGFDAVVEMDADLSHDPAVVPRLLTGLERHDLVIGSRYVAGGSVSHWGLHRRLLSWGGNRYSAVVLGVPVRDLTSGYRAYRASAIRDIDLASVQADGYGFQIEMAYRVARNGGRITEIPIHFVDRQIGQSKMSTRIAVEALLLVTKLGLQQRWRERRGQAR